ncbi:MAG: hypothetical protein ACFE7E_06475 [Candidatus Hodarchaeota archaeon]
MKSLSGNKEQKLKKGAKAEEEKQKLSGDELILHEGIKLAGAAKEQGIILRILGSAAIRINSKNHAGTHKSFRQLTDIDYVAYWKQEGKVDKFFKSFGYEPLKSRVTPFLFVTRRIYKDATGTGRPQIDVFFDKLEMNHTVDFRGKLEFDYPTIPRTELLMQKAQIVFINEKDIKDIIILLLDHQTGRNDDHGVINGKRIAQILSKDWGFWYTFTTNLEKVKKFVDKYEEFTDEQRQIIAQRVDQIREMIDKQRKTFGWKLRSRVGTKKIWYRQVEEVERADHLEEFTMSEEIMNND